jgi:hypothetical protein
VHTDDTKTVTRIVWVPPHDKGPFFSPLGVPVYQQ